MGSLSRREVSVQERVSVKEGGLSPGGESLSGRAPDRDPIYGNKHKPAVNIPLECILVMSCVLFIYH